MYDTDSKKSTSAARAEGRCSHIGNICGITVLDDSARLPGAVISALSAAKAYDHETLWIVFQPYTYTGTKAFLEDFAKALAFSGKVILTDIYGAGETDRLGISAMDLQRKITSLGGDCHYFSTFDEIENFLLENCTNGDLLITMGAGDVHKIGEKLLGI